MGHVMQRSQHSFFHCKDHDPYAWLGGNASLTDRHVGPTWDVKFCFRGPPLRNSSLAVMTQNPTMGLELIQPCTRLSRLSVAYSYLSSTCQVQTETKFLKLTYVEVEATMLQPDAFSVYENIVWCSSNASLGDVKSSSPHHGERVQ